MTLRPPLSGNGHPVPPADNVPCHNNPLYVLLSKFFSHITSGLSGLTLAQGADDGYCPARVQAAETPSSDLVGSGWIAIASRCHRGRLAPEAGGPWSRTRDC